MITAEASDLADLAHMIKGNRRSEPEEMPATVRGRRSPGEQWALPPDPDVAASLGMRDFARVRDFAWRARLRLACATSPGVRDAAWYVRRRLVSATPLGVHDIARQAR
jgi:hypothetical protein